jgi:hypothetical protein
MQPRLVALQEMCNVEPEAFVSLERRNAKWHMAASDGATRINDPVEAGRPGTPASMSTV